MSTDHENWPTGAERPAGPGEGRTAQTPTVADSGETAPGSGAHFPPPPSVPPHPGPYVPPGGAFGQDVTLAGPGGLGGAQGMHGGIPGGPFGVVPPSNGPSGKSRGGLIGIVAAAALLAGALGGGIGYVAADNAGSNDASTTISSSADPAALNRKPGSVAAIASKALKSVVTIKAESGQQSGTGTGFVYDKEGHIITNNHVVAPAANGGKLSVTFQDGKSYAASVVGRAQGYDVAVIKLDKPSGVRLTPLSLGNSDNVAVGDATIAIGAPFGLSGTVTTGIVSAKHRPVAAGGEDGAQPSYMSAIQTDASINPGNSGGPLLNASGQVIGINSAIQSTDSGGDPFGGGGQAGSVGLGFAIPINQAQWVADTLIKTGKPVYAIMGVLRNDGYKGKGAQISPKAVDGTPAVTPGGPADDAGLKPGDVILKLDDTAVEGGPQLVSEIWQHKPGDKVQVAYQRGGQENTVTLTLGERKGDNP